VTCAPFFPTSAALGAACLALAATPLSAQQPVPTPPGPPVAPTAIVTPYRAPVIALVQPAMPPEGSGAVPLDRPAVVFRFVAGEPDDPLDVRSLVVAVDGADRTALFQTTAAQAWGALASDAQLARGELQAGPHRVVARICSTRRVCASAEAQVLVVPGIATAGAPTHDTAGQSTSRRLLGAVLSATRKLLLP
jgi:hypothetical protein